MKPHRTNLLLLTTSLGVGGAEMVIRSLARSIDSERFAVSICCLTSAGSIGQELAADGIELHSFASEGARTDYLTAVKLRRLIVSKQIEVVHTHTTHALCDAVLCRWTRPFSLVHTFHFGNYPHLPRRVLWMERLASRYADRLIAVGVEQRKQIASTYDRSTDSIGVIRNGVRVPLASDTGPGSYPQVRSDTAIVVGTIASLIPQKGLYDLLNVAKRVHDVHQNVRFVLVGEGTQRGELLRRRHSMGLDDVVIMDGWMLNAGETALPGFDIYLHPSLWEAMSLSILEAMAAGKPVVSTQVGESAHVIQHGVDGYLYQPGDVSGMAAAIIELIERPEQRRRVGTSAAAKIAAAYTESTMVRAYEKLYTDVLSRAS